MKLLYLKVYLMLFLFFSLYSQTTFEKCIKYKKKYINYFYGGALEINRNYFLSGIVRSVNPLNDWRWIIVKTDSNGNVIRTKIIGTPFKGSSEPLNGAIKTGSKRNEMIFLGWSTEYCNNPYSDLDILIMKMDTNLNIQWLKSIGGNNVEEGSIIKELRDKTYLIAFSTNSYGMGYPLGIRGDIYIAQIDSMGNLMWSKTIGTYGGDAVGDIEMLPDSSILIVGGTQVDTTTMGTWPSIIKINKNGNISFSKIIYYNNNAAVGSIHRIMKTDKNYIYLLGTAIYNLPPSCYIKEVSLLLKIDTAGNIIKLKYYKTNNNPCTGSYYSNSLLFTSDFYLDSNRMIVKGIYYPFTYNRISEFSSKRAYLVTDTSLNYYYGFIHNTPYDEYNSRGSVNTFIKLPNKSFLSTGGGITTTTTFTDLAGTLNKTDPFLNSCSPNIPLQIEEDTLPPYIIISNTYSITSVNQGIVLSWTPTVTEGGYDSILCYCPDIPVNIQKSPVTCYANGSASVIPTTAGNYSYSWFPPVSTTNSATNLPVGDYTVTITDSTGCRKTMVITISANFSLPLSITGNSTICSGQTTTLTLHGAQALTWNTGQTDSSIIVQPFSTTTYSAVAIAGSCTDTIYYTVNVLPTPTIYLSASAYTLNIGDTALVQASGAAFYSWSPTFGVSAPNSPTTLITPTATTQYCIIGKDSSLSCSDTACLQLTTEGSCSDIHIPNIFTPNNDNINDTWHISFPCPQLISNFRLSVFDRWGVLLFEANQHNAQWDGRTGSGEPVPTGTYFFTAEFKLNNKKQKLKGYITLLR